MGDEVVGGVDVLELKSGVFDLAVVLRPKELQDAVVGRAEQRALGRVGMPGAKGVDEGALVVVAGAGTVGVLDSWSVENIVLVLSALI